MTQGHGAEGYDSAHRYTRRAVLGAVAAVGMLAPAAPAVLAARPGERPPRGRARRPAGGDAEPADARPAPAPGPAATPDAAATPEVWGTSRTGRGAGVRGNGRWGVVGEGTHTGVTGTGFVGIRGTTSIAEGEQGGVGVWAQAATPGSTALRAEGPSEFHGITTFSRGGAVSVRRGSKHVTVSGLPLTADTAILATLQDRVNGLYLHAVEADVAKGSFTIFLSAAPARDVRIGWLALG